MSKGEETKQRVVLRAGKLLNRTGYFSTPMSAILKEVGLQKGGVYNHFSSKEELALECFRSNTSELGHFLGDLAQSSDDPELVLFSLIDASVEIASGKVVSGGCPVLNAGTEADFVSDPLKDEVFTAIEHLRSLILIPLKRLENEGRLKRGTDINSLSYFIIATLEGGMLLVKISSDLESQAEVIKNLKKMMKTYFV